MNRKRSGKFRKISCGVLLGLLALCLVGAGISALSNRNLPQRPELVDRLDPLDKTRLEEALHLKQALGEATWPGLGQAAIPVSLHNQAYSFLIDYPAQPPAGWEVVEGDDIAGKPYYRKAEAEAQNFAVLVGDTWVASMATKTEVDLFLIELYQGFLPPVIEQIFPYRLMLQATEVQIGGVLHEGFHVLQAQLAADRLHIAENAHHLGDSYWNDNAENLALWKAEVNLLAKALQAKTDDEAVELASQFLDHRQNRRQQTGLSAGLVDYERQVEWEEGLGKYVELEILRQAFESKEYLPLEAMQADPAFKGYQTFNQRWSQEIISMKLQTNQKGEVSFYWTGMAQAVLLDRLSPGWKVKALDEGVYLEDLLKEAVK